MLQNSHPKHSNLCLLSLAEVGQLVFGSLNISWEHQLGDFFPIECIYCLFILLNIKFGEWFCYCKQ